MCNWGTYDCNEYDSLKMSTDMDVGSIVFCLDILKIKKFQEDLKVKQVK